MTSISIIAKNKCTLNVDVQGNYTLQLTGVQGPYNIVLLKGGVDKIELVSQPSLRYRPKADRIHDREQALQKPGITQAFINALLQEITQIENDPTPEWAPPPAFTGFVRDVIIDDVVNYDFERFITYWSKTIDKDVITAVAGSTIVSLFDSLFATYKSIHESSVIAYEEMYSKFTFHPIITYCTPRLMYLLGINTLPSKAKSDFIPIMNGSPYLFIECDKLYSPMRYCWQTHPSAPSTYAAVKKLVSVSYNTNMVGQPFNLAGTQFIVNGNELRDVNFTITGMHGEEIEFASDLLWQFELTRMPDEDLSAYPGLLPPEEQTGATEEQTEQTSTEQEAENTEHAETSTEPDGTEQEAENTNEAQPKKLVEQPTGLMHTGIPSVFELIKPI